MFNRINPSMEGKRRKIMPGYNYFSGNGIFDTVAYKIFQ
jgi:hypothetical protein